MAIRVSSDHVIEETIATFPFFANRRKCRYEFLSITRNFKEPMIRGAIRKGGEHLVRATKDSTGKYVSPFPQPYLESNLKNHIHVWRTRKIPPPLKFLDGTKPDSLIKVHKPDQKALAQTDEPHFTWMGHASCYFQSDGIRFITDPAFSKRCSPSQLVGPKRIVPAPCEIEELPIDVVLLSHTHYDHLDYNTARKIGNRALWIVPMGVKSWLRSKCGIDNCVELDWWDTIELGTTVQGKDQNNQTNQDNQNNQTNQTNQTNQINQNIQNIQDNQDNQHNQHNVDPIQTLNTVEKPFTQVTFTPAKHWTKRTFWDQNQCLWGGFAVRAPSSSWYFAGDSAWDEGLFKTIGEELGPFDLASIGIGAYRPRAVMADSHTDPGEALDIFRDVNAKKMHSMHWGTWKLADEANIEPALDLGKAREERDISHEEAFTMDMGKTVSLNDHALLSSMDLVYKYPKLYEEFKEMERGDVDEKTYIIDSPLYSAEV